MTQRKYFQSGDSALIITFGEGISEAVNSSVYEAMACIKNTRLKGVIDMVPSYRSLMVLYNPLAYAYEELIDVLEGLIEKGDHSLRQSNEIIEIPVLYGGSKGPDLEKLAAYHQLSVKEVISLHSDPLYRVYMLGFQPGFPYLGGMPSALATPRLSSPRQCVPKGSVGIAGHQTGIYPSESPGGWHIIGRTPMALVDWTDEQLTVIQPGQLVRFVPIDSEGYEEYLKGAQLDDGDN